MTPNPLLGVFFHWIGGLASASFYVPYRSVRGWSWEVLWLVGGIFSWIIAPWLFAGLRSHDLLAVLAATAPRTLALCYLFGLLWGFGGLTFGLSMRYLGISLGTAIALGLTAAFGTLIPPLVSGQLFGSLIHTTGGRVVLAGVAIALAGIAVVGKAGHDKELEQAARHLDDSGQPQARDFRKGIAVAVFSGIMSSCFAYGLDAGDPIRHLTLAHGTDPLAQGLPVLVVVLLGGFTTNAIWCLYLIVRNASAGELKGEVKVAGADAVAPLTRNYLLCALGGTAWYLQFFFYTMGESQMGRYAFSSWTLHMSSIIIFATLWGLALKEWKGASARSLGVMTLGLAILIGATVVIGVGNMLVVRG
ncbi:MAG: L-rhamnose/proton symporter RhaT [Gammaproteobacteria bacterium]|nr:L-rhamnose/proton symporter RhaT [Gammaproteobacteria bacterium]